MNWSQRVRDIWDTVDKNDPKGFASFLTDDAEFRFNNGPVSVGREDIASGVSDFLELLGGIRHDIRNVWRDGDHVIAQIVTDYTRKDGRVVSVPVIDVFRLRGELIESYPIYGDSSPVFAA
jgi:ketosteroid isomerase-like protein